MTKPTYETVFDRSRQFDNKREAIIMGAAQCFHENGFANTSLDQIAKRLSVTKKALYHYIKNKNEILFEIFIMWLDSQADAILAAEQLEGSAEEKLRLYVTSYINKVVSDLTPMDRIAGEITLLADEQQSIINTRRHDNDARIRSIIEAGIKSRTFVKCHSAIAVYNLHAAIDWFFKWFHEGGKLTQEQAIEEMLAIYLNGLRR